MAALAEAHADEARGDGRVVVVTGEPGIGKTSLVTEFLTGLEPGARVLLGTCDDLSIPRPLGAIHDLAGTLARALRRRWRGRPPISSSTGTYLTRRPWEDFVFQKHKLPRPGTDPHG